jgi:HK97 family phage prohead protease
MATPEIKRELRSASLIDAETKGRTVRGYAAVYDSPWNQDLIEQMGYVEKIARGAFRKALGRAGNVPLLVQHERRDMLATTRNKSLRLKDEAKGLYFEADLPNTSLGNDVLEQIKRGDIWGMSYGMASDPQTDSTYTQNPPQRTIHNVQRLLDVTLTYEPSYEAATVELRSQGFVALPMQELFVGAEEQGEDAAGELSSHDVSHFIARRRALEQSILEKGGVLP